MRFNTVLGHVDKPRPRHPPESLDSGGWLYFSKERHMDAYHLKCKLAKASTDAERDELRRLIEAEESRSKPPHVSGLADAATVSPPVPVATNQDQTFEIIRKQLALAVKENREQGILDFGKLLVDSTLQDRQTQRDTGRITDRSACESALTVFQDVYVSVVVQNCRSTFFLKAFTERFARQFDEIVRYASHDIIPEHYPSEVAEDHVHALRRFVPPKCSQFSDLRKLVQDQIAYWGSIPDTILTRKFIKLGALIDRAESRLAVSRVDTLAPSDLAAMGLRLEVMFAADFRPNPAHWREDMAAQLDGLILQQARSGNPYYAGDLQSWRDDSKRGKLTNQFLRLLRASSEGSESWFDDAQSLVSQFPAIMSAIMQEGLDRTAVLDRFVAGGAERHTMPVPL